MFALMRSVLKIARLLSLATGMLLTLPSSSKATDTLKVGVYVAPPFTYMTSSESIAGAMIDLWTDVSQRLDVSYELFPTDITRGINGLQSGQYDVLVGGVTVTARRESMIDFGPSILPSGIATVVSEDRVPNKFETYYEPILLSLLRVLSVLIGFMLTSALLVWIVERKDKHHEREKQIRHFGDGIWWSAVTLSTVGYGDKVPHTRIGRFIGITWIFLGVILISFFTANTAAILSKPVPVIELTLADISEHKVGALINSAAAEFLEDRNVSFTKYEELDELLSAVSDNKIEVAVGNFPEMSDALDNSTTHKLILSNRLLAYTFMAWAFPDQSPILEAIDESLLEVVTEERWQDAFNEYVQRR